MNAKAKFTKAKFAKSEFAKLWRPNLPGIDSSGIELFSAQLFRHAFSKHMHEEYTIGLNHAGQGGFTHRGETWRSYPGSFNLINPGELHTGQVASDAGWTFCNLYISVPRVKQILTQLEWTSGSLPYFSQPVVCDRSLQTSFHKLFQALSYPTPQLEQQTLLLEVLSQLFLNHTKPRHALRSPQPETKAVSLIRAYLEAHYAEEVSIATLAQQAGLSPYYLIRSFHQQVGVPPHGYQRHWQLLQAKRSLRTSQPLAEIALEHGFYDQSHLNRSFKRAFGITPGQYQRAILSNTIAPECL